ncbi:unnamed protein product [Caretta caretta]
MCQAIQETSLASAAIRQYQWKAKILHVFAIDCPEEASVLECKRKRVPQSVGEKAKGRGPELVFFVFSSELTGCSVRGGSAIEEHNSFFEEVVELVTYRIMYSS